MSASNETAQPSPDRRNGKVFCVGFNKTGTTSVKVALEELGYRVGHQPEAEKLISYWARRDFAPVIEYCDSAEAFQDIPFSLPFTYQSLDAAFPGSKFVLTVRSSSDEWYRSLVSFHGKLFSQGRVPTEEDLARAEYRWRGWILFCMRSIYSFPNGDPYNKACLVRVYESHIAAVQEYFRHRPQDLLTVNLADPDSYSRFCEFLCKTPASRGFPWENRSS